MAAAGPSQSPLIPPVPGKDKAAPCVQGSGANAFQPPGQPRPLAPSPASPRRPLPGALPFLLPLLASGSWKLPQLPPPALSSLEWRLVHSSGPPRAGAKCGPGRPPRQLPPDGGEGRAAPGLGTCRRKLAACLPPSVRRGRTPGQGPPRRSALLLRPLPTAASPCPRRGEARWAPLGPPG